MTRCLPRRQTGRQRLLVLAAALATLPALMACGDETLSAYADRDVVWQLQEIDGTPFPAEATLEFPEPGGIAGTAPCNRYSGALTAPYPWFALGPVMSTRRACPDLDAETRYFAALAAMEIAEVSGAVLVLSNEAGREMVFHAR